LRANGRCSPLNARRQAAFCTASDIRRNGEPCCGELCCAGLRQGRRRSLRQDRHKGRKVEREEVEKGGMAGPKRRRLESKIHILPIPQIDPGNKSSELLLYSPSFSYQQRNRGFAATDVGQRAAGATRV
jgi:hypothetical protein